MSSTTKQTKPRARKSRAKYPPSNRTLQMTIQALGITEQSADDAAVISKQLPRLSPEAKAWIREESEGVIASVRDNAEVHFPVSSEFHPIIQDFLKLPDIENLLVSAHPVYLALLRFPHSDPEFSSRVFDPEYLAKNFNQHEFDKYMKRQEKNEGSSMIFIVEQYSFGVQTATNVPPLSEQLFDESICAESRLMKLFFDQAMPDDLRAKDIKYELTPRETTEFIKATQRFHQWCKHDVRGKNQTYVYLGCDRGLLKHRLLGSKSKKVDCPARIHLKNRGESKIQVTHMFHHNHSYFDAEYTSYDDQEEEEEEDEEKEKVSTTLELSPSILDWDDSDILNVDGDTSLSLLPSSPSANVLEFVSTLQSFKEELDRASSVVLRRGNEEEMLKFANVMKGMQQSMDKRINPESSKVTKPRKSRI